MPLLAALCQSCHLKYDGPRHNVAQALDTFIGTLLQKMVEEPHKGEYWQQEIKVAMAKKQEAMVLAAREHSADTSKMLKDTKEGN